MRSSSLSISTRTSIARWGSLPGQLFLQAASDERRDQLLDVAVEDRELFDAARAEETVLRTGHQVDGLDFGRLQAIQLVHLRLVLEVGDRAQSLDDRAGSDGAGEVDDQRLECLRAD